LSRERRGPAHLQEVRPIEAAEELDERGDETSPPGLVTGANPRPVVPMEVFVEKEMVAPVRVALKLFHTPVDGPPAVLVA